MHSKEADIYATNVITFQLFENKACKRRWSPVDYFSMYSIIRQKEG